MITFEREKENKYDGFKPNTIFRTLSAISFYECSDLFVYFESLTVLKPRTFKKKQKKQKKKPKVHFFILYELMFSLCTRNSGMAFKG